MGHEEPPATSHDERTEQHLQIVYTRQTQRRQIFMQELKIHRIKTEKKLFKEINDAVGPRWYQALSVSQREALDNLKNAIHQDLLEGRPHRTSSIMRALGLYPRPKRADLMTCNYMGRNDSKEMLAHLYFLTFGYSIDGKRISYSLNAKLILSAILYLGLQNLMHLLREKFHPKISDNDHPPKLKPKPEPPLLSPYLEKMIAVLWEKPIYKRPPPLPLPNLDDLNDPYEEEPIMRKPPPPPPPPPPPKKRIPREVCDELADVYTLNLSKPSESDIAIKKPTKANRRGRLSRTSILEGKKIYGLGSTCRRNKTGRRKKPVPPSTGLGNAQYNINGVFIVNNKTVFVLGNVSILPAKGDLIHGGYTNNGSQCININCGYREWPPVNIPDPCDCMKKWHDTVFEYLKNTKCYCDHNYDYYNEGTFPIGELPFFIKPNRQGPMQFNYDTIFNMDSKQLLVEKEFKKLWETDSVLHVGDGTEMIKNDKKKKSRRSSKTCLGPNPKPEDYLRCALRFMRPVNIAARLPDLHLVPELKEWMRRRIYGPLTKYERADLLRKSTVFWSYFSTLGVRGYGHVSPPKDIQFVGQTNKKKLNENFRSYTRNYKLAIYKSHAYITNLLWRTMYQAELPDKKFRQIFFSYLFGTLKDLHLIRPYNSRETDEWKNVLSKKRYICLPAGVNKLES